MCDEGAFYVTAAQRVSVSRALWRLARRDEVFHVDNSPVAADNYGPDTFMRARRLVYGTRERKGLPEWLGTGYFVSAPLAGPFGPADSQDLQVFDFPE